MTLKHRRELMQWVTSIAIATGLVIPAFFLGRLIGWLSTIGG